MGILVTKATLPPFEEFTQEIKDIWETHWLTNMGAKHDRLQELLEQRLDSRHVVLYTNGHLALENIICAYNFPENSEVITTPFTFASTTHAIVRNGLKPVFCDVDPVTLCMDSSKIEALITEKTVAVLPVHVYGNVCDVEEIGRIAGKYNLKVIYDAAHTFGEKYKGRSVASYGDASIVSFHATKVFNTIEGGCIAFEDDNLVQVLNDLKNFGIRGPEEVRYVGGNAKMNEFQAAMGICNLKYLDQNIEKRLCLDSLYRKLLGNTDGLQLKCMQADVCFNGAYFPVLFNGFRKTRDQVFALLEEHDIHARKYFYPVIQDFDCYSNVYDSSMTPVAKQASESVLCLPIYPDLTDNDVRTICSLILE